VGAGTLRVTGVAPVILGSAVTANDVAASDATGAITLGLVGVATVGTVVTGSGDDVITISTAARTSGDYTISTGAGSDSLVLSFAEGFSWNGGLGYDTLKLNTTLDLSAQAVTLTNVDAISLDTGDNGTESLTITSAQFNTNTTFTLLGGGINDDTLIVKGAETADTINASAVSVEVSEAYLTLNGNGGADTITGSAFADIINGGAGADTMSGGDFADTYIFNTDNVESGESIFEASNGLGIDTVSVVTTTVFTTMTSASFDEIEALTFASGASGTFTGAQLTGEAITLTGDSVGTETLTVNVGLVRLLCLA
jgi:Ca2+-binding RTX toxin-like protein